MATIMVVDDDEAFAYAVTRHLKKAGYQVVTATDTMAALREFDAGKQRIDCLVADIVMPKGMPHGLALASMARQRNVNIPVIFVTAYSDMKEIAEEYRATCLGKPVDVDMILAAVRKHLPEAPAS